ncbi:MAG: sugar phosphate nucleotidyltransferase [Pseudomonadota bacterium]
MKTVLFCGGFGTRLRDYSDRLPKPLVSVGNRPILWNLMKYYAFHGHRDFVLCLGYRGDLIKRFFLSYDECLSTDFIMTPTHDRRERKVELLGPDISDWTITFRDTGLHNNIAERLMAVREEVREEEMFLANYSDALTDLPLNDLIERFKNSDAVATFVSVRPSNGLSKIETDADGTVTGIDYLSDSVLINGGFFVFRNAIFDYIKRGDELVEAPFRRLIRERKLLTYRYDGFWRAMDTFKDKKKYDDMYESGERPWEVWASAEGPNPC